MLEFLKDRKFIIWIIFTLVFIIMSFRLSILTLVEGDKYYSESLNIRLKKKNIISKRGNIYDINNNILAKNNITYSLEFLAEKKLSLSQEKMIINLFKLLNESGEDYLKIPIVIKNNEFFYQKDIDRENWLLENGFEKNATANEVLEYYKKREYISEDEDSFYSIKILNSKGIYLPIKIDEMIFSYENEILKFLKNYGIKTKVSAKEAFYKLRKYYKIDEKYNDEEAYYLITIKDMIRSKGYLIYEPIKIAKNISKENAIFIQEKGVDFPNINVVVESYRTYPYNNVASHILGYMGYISTSNEIQKYVKEKNYNSDDMIGKTGIEGRFEEELKGKNGYKWIEVDSKGNFIKNIDNYVADERFKDLDAVAGKDIQLTIDIDFQQKNEEIVKDFLEALREGTVYNSKYGNIKIDKKYPNAKTAAVVVQNVKNGEILSLVSYPNYDVNLFARGISNENWQSLQPKNPKNPLEPKPLYNLATMSAIQPGSTFKMVTAFAALEKGMDPNLKLRDTGYIRTNDNRTFGCWIWNMSRGSHGLVDLKRALGVSCNYYFYDISAGYDFAERKNLDIKMGIDDILNAAQKFGLGSPTGIEIPESYLGLPDIESKKNTTLYYLRAELKNDIFKYVDRNYYDTDEKINDLISQIVDIAKYNSEISKKDLNEKLFNIIVNADRQKIQKLSDIIKINYLNNMKWTSGDGFNLAIGQGANSYTPIQMARYVSTIANGGYLYDTTVVKSIGGEEIIRNNPIFIDDNNKLKYIKEGMYYVANVNDNGTVYRFFKDFPIKIGAKTGTAQKEGKQPAIDETEYILKNLSKIAPNIKADELEKKTVEILEERNKKISGSFANINDNVNDFEKQNMIDELDKINFNKYLSREYAMREALKIMTDYEITDEKIDFYKQDYESFSWFVAFAPFDNPEIAIVAMIPQGGSGLFSSALCREIIGNYFEMKK